jgi:hypothetical protein
VVLVLAGACMAGLAYMQHAAADSLASISATVHVPRPHTPAIISIPEDAATVPSGDTMVVGSCPLISPQAVIIVSVDGHNIGSAVCDGTNDFSLAANLTPGTHTLVATPYSIDNDTGPGSQAVHVTASAAKTVAATSAAMLTPASQFTTLSSNKTVDWHGVVAGKNGPYKLLLDWGDGSYGTYDVYAGTQHVHHQYAQLAAYNITVGLRDGSGTYQFQQFAAASTNPASLAAIGLTNTSYDQSSHTTVIGLYGLFVTVVAVAAIVRLHASPFAYAAIRLGHHGKA